MKIAIVFSNKDDAGKNIAVQLARNFEFKLTNDRFAGNNVFQKGNLFLLEVNDSQITSDFVNDFDADAFVFASKHESESKKPCLTVHSIGNFSKPDFGGKEKTLVPCSAMLNSFLLQKISHFANRFKIDWQVCFEATHHGPFLSKPACFVEIGSSFEEWVNDFAGRVVASSINSLASFSFESENEKANNIGIGFGGTHYPEKFSSLVLNKGIQLGFIVSKHSLDFLDKELFQQLVEKTFEKPNFCVIDEKGVNAKQRELISAFAVESGLDLKESREF